MLFRYGLTEMGHLDKLNQVSWFTLNSYLLPQYLLLLDASGIRDMFGSFIYFQIYIEMQTFL